MNIKALNEWDSRYAGNVDWRQKLDTQRGAVLANELKHNACKLAKWTVQAMLVGSDIIKFGYANSVVTCHISSCQAFGFCLFSFKLFLSDDSLVRMTCNFVLIFQNNVCTCLIKTYFTDIRLINVGKFPHLQERAEYDS